MLLWLLNPNHTIGQYNSFQPSHTMFYCNLWKFLVRSILLYFHLEFSFFFLLFPCLTSLYTRSSFLYVGKWKDWLWRKKEGGRDYITMKTWSSKLEKHWQPRGWVLWLCLLCITNSMLCNVFPDGAITDILLVGISVGSNAPLQINLALFYRV